MIIDSQRATASGGSACGGSNLADLAGWLRYPFNLFAAKDLHVNSCGAEPCHVVPL